MRHRQIAKNHSLAPAIAITLFIVSAFITLSVMPAYAQKAVGCVCYCGITLAPPCSEAACKRACGWQEPRSGSLPSTSGGRTSSSSPSYTMPNVGATLGAAIGNIFQQQMQQQNYNAPYNLNEKGNAAYRNGNWEAAMQYYRQALQYSPNDQVIRQNLENAERNFAQAQAMARQEEQSAGAMRAGLSGLEARLNSLKSEAARGVDFDGKQTPGSTSPGGLDFMADAPAPRPAQTASLAGSGPGVDSSVVDLRDVAHKPLVVDPGTVSGPQPQSLPLPQQITDVAGDEEWSLFTEDEIRSLLKPVQKKSAWPGPKNYEEPLINPLRDPERAKALYEADKAWINQKIKTRNGEEVLKSLEADKKINEARDRIVREQIQTEYEVQVKAYREMAKEIEDMMKAQGVTEAEAFDAKVKKNPQLQARVNELVQRTKQRIAVGMKQARDKAYDDMYAEITKWTKEQGGK